MWSIPDIHIFIFFNNHNQSYIGTCVIQSESPSISLCIERKKCTYISPYIFTMFCCSTDKCFTYCFISSVCIMTMMVYFPYSLDNAVGTDVWIMVIGYFIQLNNTMISSGLWNSFRMYCFRLTINVLNWYLASLYLVVVPKNAPNYSTLPLKLRIEGVFSVWTKRPVHLPHPW